MNVSNLFLKRNLHVSDGLSVHHREYKTVHTATGCLLASGHLSNRYCCLLASGHLSNRYCCLLASGHLSNRYCCLLASWHLSNRYCCLLASGYPLASRQQYLFDKWLLLYVQSCIPDDGRKYRPKHVQCHSKINILIHWCI